MGVIREFRCPSCRKEWQLSVGHGIRHGILGQVMKVFSEDIQKQILEDVDTGQLPLFDFNYRAAVCRQCRTITAVPVLRMIENGKFYMGGCPDCGGIAELLEEDSKIACPSCEKSELDTQDMGHWD